MLACWLEYSRFISWASSGCLLSGLNTVAHSADNISFHENNERITGSICLQPTPLHFFLQKNSLILDDSQNRSVEFKKGGNEPKNKKAVRYYSTYSTQEVFLQKFP